MKQVVKSAQAQRDLDTQAAFLQRSSPNVAIRFLESADSEMAKLASMPGLGGRWETNNPQLADMRVWPVKGFKNHLIFYREIDQGIEVIRVLHGAQDIEAIFAE